MVAVIVAYSTQNIERSILSRDIIVDDAAKLGEELDMVLSYTYIRGEGAKE
jgi:hypothetical protein